MFLKKSFDTLNFGIEFKAKCLCGQALGPRFDILGDVQQ
jgi:hypothetical protein